MFGGQSDMKNNELLSLDVQNYYWSLLSAEGKAPKPRIGHSILCHNNQLIIYGGQG